MLNLAAQNIFSQGTMLQGMAVMAGAANQEMLGIAGRIDYLLDNGPSIDPAQIPADLQDRVISLPEDPDFVFEQALLQQLVTGELASTEPQLRILSRSIVARVGELDPEAHAHFVSLTGPQSQAPLSGRYRRIAARSTRSTISPLSRLDVSPVAGPTYKSDIRKVTIMFTDFASFTSKTEDLSPDQMDELLNTCFERLGDHVMAQDGHIFKYIGDALMVGFGAPKTHDNDAVRGIRTALGMLEELKVLNQDLQARGLPTFEMRVGMHTGQTFAGLIGARGDKRYDLVAKSVNVASRMESLKAESKLGGVEALKSLTELGDNNIFIGEHMLSDPEIARRVEVELIGEFEVDEQSSPLRIYRIVKIKDESVLGAEALKALTKPGESRIFISEKTLAEPEVARRFEVEFVAEVEVKGISRPIKVYNVIRERTEAEIAGAAIGFDAQFRGREAEMAVLRQNFQLAKSSEARVVMVSGGPGQGKSRLKREFLREAVEEYKGNLGIVQAKGAEGNRHIPYSFMDEALVRLAGIDPTDSQSIMETKIRNMVSSNVAASDEEKERVAQLIGQVTGIPFNITGNGMHETDDTIKTRVRVYQEVNALQFNAKEYHSSVNSAVFQLFAGLAEKTPVIFTLEDLHWADEASLDLIRLLMAELRRSPVLFLGLTRPELMREITDERADDAANEEAEPREVLGLFPSNMTTELVLRELDAEAMEAIVEEYLSEDYDAAERAEIAQFIISHSSGNPYFISEMAEAANQGWMRRDPNSGQWEFVSVTGERVTPGAESLLQARIDRLESDERELVEAASVLRGSFDIKTLQALGVQEPERVLGVLEGKDIILRRGQDHYDFRHDMMRETAYGMIKASRRRTWHRQIAEIYLRASKLDHAKIAMNLELSGNDIDAAGHYHKAAERDFKRGLNISALYFYRKEHELGQSVDRRTTVSGLIGLSKVSLEEKEYDKALRDVEQALEIIEERPFKDRELHADCYKQLGNTLHAMNRIEEAIAIAKQGLKLFSRDEITIKKCNLLLLRGRLEAHGKRNFVLGKQYMDEALWVAKALGESELIGNVYSNLIFIAAQYNDYLAIFKYSEQAAQLLANSEDYSAIIPMQVNAGAVLYYLGRYEDAIAKYKEAQFNSEQNYGRRHLGIIMANIGAAQRFLAQYEEAEQSFVKALACFERSPNDYYAGMAHCYRAQNFISLGQYDSAEQAIGEAAAIAIVSDDKKLNAMSTILSAQVAIERGQFDEAIKFSSKAYEIAKEINIEEYDLQIRLVHAQALRAKNKYYEAWQVILEAKGMLEKATKGIGDEALRASFENTDVNREIMALEKTLGFESSLGDRNIVLGELRRKAAAVRPGGVPPELEGIVSKVSYNKIQLFNGDSDRPYAATLLNMPHVQVFHNLLTRRVEVPRNEGPFRVLWAENIQWNPYFQSAQLYAQVEFELKARFKWLTDIILAIAGIGPRISVRYKDDIHFDNDSINIEMALDEAYDGTRFTREQFGNVSFELRPIENDKTILMMKMQGKAFTLHPDVFLREFVKVLTAQSPDSRP